MNKRTPAQDFVRELDLLDAEVPVDQDDARETLNEFGLEPVAVLREGRAAVERFDAAHRAPASESRARPRKRWQRAGVVAAVVATLAAAFGVWRMVRDTPPGEERAPASLRTAAAHSPQRLAVRDWEPAHSSLKDLAVPGGTPALEPAPTDADGHLEVAVQAAGEPKPGAQVRLYLRGPRDPSRLFFDWHLAGSGVTDAQGKVRVAAPAGAYLLAVRAPGFAVAHRDVSRAMVGAKAEPLTQVSVQLEKGSALRGRVVEAGSGAEVPLAQISLARSGPWTAEASLPASAMDAPPEETLFATADARGRFVLPQVEAGERHLLGTALGHGQANQQLFFPHRDELVLELPVAASLEGFVVDANGAPARGAEVTVVYATAKGFDEMVRTVTSPQGGFAAEVLPGRCTVTARLGDQTGAADQAVVASAGQTVRGISLRLGAAGAIEGAVMAKGTHTPVEGARVGLSASGGSGDFGRTLTAEGGKFAVGRLAPGIYDVLVDAEGYSPFMRRGIHVGAAQSFPLSLELERSAAVSGTVRDAAGNPVANAMVGAGPWFGGVSNANGAAQVRTGADGSYRITGVDIGQVRLYAGHQPGAWLALGHAEVQSGQEAHVDLVLHDPGTLVGQVTLKSGAPPSEAVLVRAMPRDGDTLPTPAEFRTAVVDAQGRYTLELPSGLYSVGAYRTSDHEIAAPPMGAGITVRAGETTAADLTLEEAALVLSGTVLEPDGRPSPMAWVSLSAGPDPFLLMMPADDKGTFRIPFNASAPGLPSVFEVSARNGGRSGRVASVSTGTQGVVVRMSEGGSIEGTVVGEPAPRSVVVRMSALNQELVIGPNGNGEEFLGNTFSIPEVPASAVRVSVTTSDGRSGSTEATVSAGQTARVTVELQGLGALTGRLLWPGGKPAAGALVGLDFDLPHAAGADGSFSLRDIAVGQHTLHAVGTGGSPLGKTVSVTAGQVVDVGTLTLTRAQEGSKP